MKNIIFKCCLMFLLVGTLMSCDDKNDDTTGSLNLQFNLVYNDQPLPIFEGKMDYPDGSSIFFDRFNLFLSNASLLDGGKNEDVFDVRFFDFTDLQDLESAKRGLTLNIKELPVGAYEGIELGIGVAPELNATTPSDYSSSHPLSNNYWSQWNSYISMVIEGKADTDGTGIYDLIFTYHIGKDPAYSLKQLDTPITIKAGETTTLEIKIDLLDMFSQEGDYLDIQDKPIDHSTTPEIYDFIRANMSKAVKL